MQLLNFSLEKNIELLMKTLNTANQETVRCFDSVQNFSDQNFDKIHCLIRLPRYIIPIAKEGLSQKID